MSACAKCGHPPSDHAPDADQAGRRSCVLRGCPCRMYQLPTPADRAARLEAVYDAALALCYRLRCKRARTRAEQGLCEACARVGA